MTDSPSSPEQKLVDDVREFGWHVVKVMHDRDGRPAWAYSIGLFHTFAHPEIIVFGLELETMHRVINDLGASVKQGRRYRDGEHDADLLDGYDAIVRTVFPLWLPETVGFAGWFYGGYSFPIMQLFWPDRDGAFPWQRECDAWVRDQQPRLYATEVAESGAAWLLT